MASFSVTFRGTQVHLHSTICHGTNYQLVGLVGSGLGTAKTVKTQEGLIGLDVDEIKFRESGIGVSTRKALETASARIVARMIRKGIFEN